MIRDRQLEEMAGNAFVTEDWSRVFDGGADVKVAALRIVGGNEIKSGRIGIVDPGWVHESTGARRLERFGQLTDLEAAHVRRYRHQTIRAQEVSELLESHFVRLEEILLVYRNACCACGIW